MLVSLIPPLSIVLLNLVVCTYVVRERVRIRSGFFLLINALSLIIWAGGQMLYQGLEREVDWVLSLPYMAALLVPGNFLYYALTHPRPLRRGRYQAAAPLLIFLPAMLLTAVEIRTGGLSELFDYSLAVTAYQLETNSHRAAALYSFVLLATTLGVLGIRYSNESGPSRNLAKHLLGAVSGPLIFAGFFWATAPGGQFTVLPSPSLVFLMMAQIGLVVALRQEELRNPRTLSRVLYYAAALLVAFLFVSLLAEFHLLTQGSPILESTVFWVLAALTVAVVFITRLTWMEQKFEEVVFARAAEYRRLMNETRTELRRARERLRRAERLSAVGELAARLAHEIKNPLGPIKGYTQMMREKVEEDEEFRHREAFLRHLEVIAEEVETIDRRLRGFLHSARQPRLEQEAVDINHLVNRCGRLLEMEVQAMRELSADEPEIEIRIRPAPELPTVTGDASRLEEAIFNIARNALDSVQGARRRGGQVTLRTEPGPSGEGVPGVMIRVMDNGPGLPDVEERTLFEPFYTSKETGTGLGLAIVQSVVQAHGGDVRIVNRESGGVHASIWLPVEADPHPAALLPRVEAQVAATPPPSPHP